MVTEIDREDVRGGVCIGSTLWWLEAFGREVCRS